MNRKEFLNIKDIDIFYRKENPEPQAILHATFNYNTTRLTLTDLDRKYHYMVNPKSMWL